MSTVVDISVLRVTMWWPGSATSSFSSVQTYATQYSVGPVSTDVVPAKSLLAQHQSTLAQRPTWINESCMQGIRLWLFAAKNHSLIPCIHDSLTHVGLMLVHRMRRRPDTKSKWGECILSDMNVYRDAILSKHDTETNAGFMLVHCLPCWPNIKPTLAQRIILCWDDPGILSLSCSVVLAQPQTRWQGHRS